MDFQPPAVEIARLMRPEQTLGWWSDKRHLFKRDSTLGKIENTLHTIRLSYLDPGDPQVAAQLMYYSQRETPELATKKLVLSRKMAEELTNHLCHHVFVQVLPALLLWAVLRKQSFLYSYRLPSLLS